MDSNSNKKTNHNKSPSTTKSKKPSWIRSCFGFGSTHKTRAMADWSSEEATTGRGGRRMKGLGILRGVVKRPWGKKRDKTTSMKPMKTTEKEAEGSGRRGLEVVQDSTASKVVVVGGEIQKSLLGDESHETQWSIGGRIVKEFDITKDVSPHTCQIQSKPIKEDASGSHKAKVKKPDLKEHTKPVKLPSVARVSSKQSHRKNTKGSNMDGIIGMSILVTILMVLLLCGRLCAILCTAMWFYCMPQLTKITKNNKNNAEGNNSSAKLEIERKEIVFKGFLERKQNLITKVS